MSEKKESYQGNLFDYKILRRIFKFVKPYTLLFYSIILLTILLSILAPALPILINITIDNYISKSISGKLFQMAVIMSSILLIKAFLQYLHTYASGWLGQTIIRDIRIDLYKHITKL